jgi:DNA polymerase-3 subunit gamma/tau
LVHHVVRNGYDVQEFLAGVAEHLRNLLVARSLGADALEDVADSTRQRYAKGAQAFREADLLRLLTLAGDAEESVKSSAQPRLKVEMTLLKMAQIRRTADLERVLQKLKRLEKMVETGELPERLPDAAPPSESSSGDAGAPADGADASAPADGFAPADASPSEPSASEEHPSSPPASSGSASSGSASSGSASSASAAQRPDEASRPEQAPSPEEATRSASILPSEDVSDTESAATGPSASASAASSLGDDAESQAQEAEASGGDADARDADARDADARDADARDADDSPSPDETPDADLPPASEDTPDDRPPDGGDASSGQGLTYDLFGTPALQQSASDAEGSDPDGSNTTPPDDPPTASAPRASSGPPSVGGRHAASAQASAATAAPPRTLSEAEWERFVEVVRSRSRRLWGTLSDATPKTIEDDVFTIAVAQRFARDQLRDRASVLRECLHAATDVNVDQLHIVVEASEASSASSAAATRDPREHIRALRDTYDALDVLFEEFGAEPTW